MSRRVEDKAQLMDNLLFCQFGECYIYTCTCNIFAYNFQDAVALHKKFINECYRRLEVLYRSINALDYYKPILHVRISHDAPVWRVILSEALWELVSLCKENKLAVENFKSFCCRFYWYLYTSVGPVTARWISHSKVFVRCQQNHDCSHCTMYKHSPITIQVSYFNVLT